VRLALTVRSVWGVRLALTVLRVLWGRLVNQVLQVQLVPRVRLALTVPLDRKGNKVFKARLVQQV
jgi:hypothetical protein